MIFTDTMRRFAFGICETFCAVAVISMFLASFGYTAQQDSESEKTPKENKEPSMKPAQRGVVTVEVLMIEPEKDKERRPVARAMVYIQGVEDPRETNEKGRVRFPGVPTGTSSLQVMVINLENCRLSGISVSEGEQLVGVLVDKSQKGKCTRLK